MNVWRAFLHHSLIHTSNTLLSFLLLFYFQNKKESFFLNNIFFVSWNELLLSLSMSVFFFCYIKLHHMCVCITEKQKKCTNFQIVIIFVLNVKWMHEFVCAIRFCITRVSLWPIAVNDQCNSEILKSLVSDFSLLFFFCYLFLLEH